MARSDIAVTRHSLLAHGRALPVFLLIAFLTFVIVGTYTRRVNVTDEISTYPRAANVYSAVQGVVVKQFVTEGQVITAGAPIYQIDVSKSTHSGVISDNQQRDIDDQLARIAQIISRLESSKQATLIMLGKQKAQYTATFTRSTDILLRAQEGIRIMKENMENYRHYQTRGQINKDHLTNKVALYYQQQNFTGSTTSRGCPCALNVDARINRCSVDTSLSGCTQIISDALFNGRRLRMQAVIDLYMRECLGICVGQNLRSTEVAEILNTIALRRPLFQLLKTERELVHVPGGCTVQNRGLAHTL